MPILFTDLLALYENNADATALPMVRPYADYLAWLARQDAPTAIAVWQDYLADLDGPTLLSAPGPRPAAASGETRRWQALLSQPHTAALQGYARDHGVTLNAVMQGLWAVVLGRFTGRDDVVFGVTVAGRPTDLPGSEQMVGLFINTVPLRARLRPNQTLPDLLLDIQRAQSNLLGHQHVGLSDIQRATAGDVLFDTLTVFENYPVDSGRLSDVSRDLRVVGFEGQDATNYPLTLVVTPGERLHLRIDYDPARLISQTVEAVAARFLTLMEQAPAAPASPLYRLDTADIEDRYQQLAARNAAVQPVLLTTLPDMFEQQVALTPDNVAIVCAGTSLTYAELNAQANQVAHHLMSQGVEAGSLVGVAMERSIGMMAAVLGALKAGAAYLPLDPRLPQCRRDLMLNEARPAIVLADEAELRDRMAGLPTHNPLRGKSHREHPAYVIYTSGSTGRPKGVVVRHGELATYLAWARRLYRNEGQAGAPVNTPLSFDATVTSLFVPLLLGWPVHLL
ncbi:MAG: condensation domain-containing protein, partial [Geminicoccaceae bacterium]